MSTKNEKRRTKNWGASAPASLTGESENFMDNHKAFGNACGCIGGYAAQFFVLNS